MSERSSAEPDNSSTIFLRYSETSVRVVLDYRDLKRLLLYQYYMSQRSSAKSAIALLYNTEIFSSF